MKRRFLSLFLLFVSLLPADFIFSNGSGGAVTCTGCNDYGPIPQARPWSMSYGLKMVYTVTGLENGVYIVTFTFVEPIYSTANQRPLNVVVNDSPFLSAFDVVAAGGGKGNVEVTRGLVAVATDGKLVIILTANSTMANGKLTTHSAILSGLAVRPLWDLNPGTITVTSPSQ